MKYEIKDLQKALALAKDITEVDLSFDPKDRLVIAFTDPIGEIPTEVTIYPIRNESPSKFAEVKTIKRL